MGLFSKKYEVQVSIPMDTWLITFADNPETASTRLGLYGIVVYAESKEQAQLRAHKLVKRIDTVRKLPR